MMLKDLARVGRSSRAKSLILGVSAAALVLGTTISVVADEGGLPWIGKSAPPTGTSTLQSLSAPSGPARLVVENNGFAVALEQVESAADGQLIVYYQIRVADPRGFGQMLGIPRIFNIDGSIVLPSEYGTVGETAGFEGGIKGLPPGSSGAIFDKSKVFAGAVLRFGPFFRSSDSGFTVHATGRSLAAGHLVEVSGEAFTVQAMRNKDGTTTVEFVSTGDSPIVVLSHPGSTVVVTINGKPADIVRGSTNFAKTAGYDVNANRSAVTVAAEIEASADVVITSSSTGAVYRGKWDFPVD